MILTYLPEEDQETEKKLDALKMYSTESFK